MSQYSELTKLSKACSHCRKKKVKCDGSMPCGNCYDRNKQCTYLPRCRRRRKNNGGPIPSGESRADSTTSISHFQTGEDYVTFNEVASDNIVVGNTVLSPIGVFPHLDTAQRGGAGPSFDTARAVEPILLRASSPIDSPLFNSESLSEYDSQTNASALASRESDVDREEPTIDLKNINWEHHGPGSWLSICSQPGIRWVSIRTKAPGFSKVAHGLIADWTKHLTFSQCPIREKGPELDFETAWRYAAGYFEYSHDSIFGVVYRPEFEDYLRRHFQNPNPENEDVSSYAMRNAVFAVGCRAAALANGAKDFTEVRQKSDQFFFNAFSVYTQLLYMPTGLRAVQALIVMTSYAELLGSPAVEYMLCTAAARLSHSKGLHRRPVKAWGLPELDVLQRNWTFWAVYSYDKYIALRSGRPSMLDDDDISCEIPTTVPAGSTMEITVCTASIKHAQICSQMMKRLFSAQALKQSPESLCREVEIFENKLSEWRNLLPSHLLLDTDAFVQLKGPYKVRANIIRLHRAYYGSIIALHANFHYPWIYSRLVNVDADGNYFRDQVVRSSNHVAEAARQILASLKHWTPDIVSPSPTAFYYPMLAIINLFTYILKYPSLRTTLTDLTFLDMGSGHFGHIHQLTSSHVSFRFPREVVGLADKAMRCASSDMAGSPAGPSNANTPTRNSNDVSVDQFFDMDISTEQWNALSAEFFDDFSAAGDVIML